MLKNLSKREKIVIMVALTALVTGLFYFQLYLPMQEERLTLLEDLGSLRVQYMKVMSLIKTKLPEVKYLKGELEDQYTALLEQFPEQKEISTLLLDIERMAKEQGIALEYFSPKNIRTRGDFHELPIHISFFSSYPALVGFIYSMENSGKKMDVVSFEVKAFQNQGETLLQVDLTVNVYIVKAKT